MKEYEVYYTVGNSVGATIVKAKTKELAERVFKGISGDDILDGIFQGNKDGELKDLEIIEIKEML